MVAKNGSLDSWHNRAERLVAEGIDVITAGFPCQDISFAGEGAGLAGARSGLVWNLLRTIRLVRPKIALLENVAALLSRGLDQICGHLATVGYDTEWHCIPASAVGAPHQRDRIWIIATDAGSEQHKSNSAPISGQIAEELSRAFAYATTLHGSSLIRDEPDGDLACSKALADPARLGQQTTWYEPGSGRQAGQPSGTAWWASEPALDRVADGIPYRVDRLRGLGNAVIPQIPEIIGRAIMTAQSQQERP
jgi:DNA (cytosine-5)-methyltransferase 1